MSTFNKATRHKKHGKECPLHFTQPASQLHIKSTKTGDSGLKLELPVAPKTWRILKGLDKSKRFFDCKFKNNLVMVQRSMTQHPFCVVPSLQQQFVPVSSSRSPCEESASSEEPWLLQLILPIRAFTQQLVRFWWWQLHSVSGRMTCWSGQRFCSDPSFAQLRISHKLSCPHDRSLESALRRSMQGIYARSPRRRRRWNWNMPCLCWDHCLFLDGQYHVILWKNVRSSVICIPGSWRGSLEGQTEAEKSMRASSSRTSAFEIKNYQKLLQMHADFDLWIKRK